MLKITQDSLAKRWHQPVCLVSCPSQIKKSLLTDNSLTRRVKKRCQKTSAKFQVEVLSQGITQPSVLENIALGQKPRARALIREVMLKCSTAEMVYARTIIPLKTLSGKERRLGRLGNKPLGAYLFAQKHLKRDPLQINTLMQGTQQYWMRRSVFYLQQKPLMVYEAFLPEFLYRIT